VVVRATLLVVPRTSTTLNGLLVQYFEHELTAPRRGPSPVQPPTAPVPTLPPSAPSPRP
jgi:hypothetical protein